MRVFKESKFTRASSSLTKVTFEEMIKDKLDIMRFWAIPKHAGDLEAQLGVADHMIHQQQIVNRVGTLKVEVCNYIRPMDPRTRQLEPRTEQLGGSLKHKSTSNHEQRPLTFDFLESRLDELYPDRPTNTPPHLFGVKHLPLQKDLKINSITQPLNREINAQSPIALGMLLQQDRITRRELDTMNTSSAPHSQSPPPLSAPFPGTEARNSDLCLEGNEKDTPWVRIVKGAIQAFGTSMAGYSFLDGESEAFRVGEAFEIVELPYRVTITSPSLLVGSTFVILDAFKIPQLKGHELVANGPRICFLAAAPLLSPDKKLCGVLWISGSQPRASFSLSDRQKLTDMASRFMDEIRDALNSLPSSSKRGSIPLLQRDSLISGIEFIQENQAVSSHSQMTRDLVPTPLDINKCGQVQQQIRNGQLTPPSSAESNHNPSFGKFDQGDCRPGPHVVYPTLPMSSSPDLLVDEDEIPDIPKFDLNESSQKGLEEDAVATFFEMKDEECFEQLEPSPKNANTASPFPARYQKKDPRKTNQASTKSSTLRKKSMPKIDESGLAQDLARALAAKAQEFEFDLMYIVQIKPPVEEKRGGAALDPSIKIISAFGLKEKHYPFLELHLRALRQRAPLIFNSGAPSSREARYTYGILVKITARGGITPESNDGVLLCAFREVHHQKPGLEEEKKLEEFAKSLRPKFLEPEIATTSKTSINQQPIKTPIGLTPDISARLENARRQVHNTTYSPMYGANPDRTASTIGNADTNFALAARSGTKSSQLLDNGQGISNLRTSARNTAKSKHGLSLEHQRYTPRSSKLTEASNYASSMIDATHRIIEKPPPSTTLSSHLSSSNQNLPKVSSQDRG